MRHDSCYFANGLPKMNVFLPAANVWLAIETSTSRNHLYARVARTIVSTGSNLGRSRASTSRCSRNTRPRSSCACSIRPTQPRNRSALRCRNRPTRSGTPTCPTFSPSSSTAIASTGPTSQQNGHRFNPNKIVLDPYAKAIGRDLRWDDSLFGYKIGDPQADLSFDTRDNAAFAPLAAVIDPPSPGATIARRIRPGTRR